MNCPRCGRELRNTSDTNSLQWNINVYRNSGLPLEFYASHLAFRCENKTCHPMHEKSKYLDKTWYIYLQTGNFYYYYEGSWFHLKKARNVEKSKIIGGQFV